MKAICLCLFMLLHLAINAACTQAPATPHRPDQTAAGQKYSVRIITAGAGTYGYEIYTAGKLLIRQLAVPAVPGNKGFQRKPDAEKVANLVVTKLSHGMMPPTVDKPELDKLHIQY